MGFGAVVSTVIPKGLLTWRILTNRCREKREILGTLALFSSSARLQLHFLRIYIVVSGGSGIGAKWPPSREVRRILVWRTFNRRKRKLVKPHPIGSHQAIVFRQRTYPIRCDLTVTSNAACMYIVYDPLVIASDRSAGPWGLLVTPERTGGPQKKNKKTEWWLTRL